MSETDDDRPQAYLEALERATDPAQSYFATVALPRLLMGPTLPDPDDMVDCPRCHGKVSDLGDCQCECTACGWRGTLRDA